MDVKSVLKNVKTRGWRKTFQSYRARKQKSQLLYKNNKEYEKALKDLNNISTEISVLPKYATMLQLLDNTIDVLDKLGDLPDRKTDRILNTLEKIISISIQILQENDNLSIEDEQDFWARITQIKKINGYKEAVQWLYVKYNLDALNNIPLLPDYTSMSEILNKTTNIIIDTKDLSDNDKKIALNMILEQIIKTVDLFQRTKNLSSDERDLVLEKTIRTVSDMVKVFQRITTFTPEEKISFLEKITYIETTKGYKGSIHRIYVKNILPQIYNEKKHDPLEEKVVFMERGARKSPSLNYIYKKMTKDKKYRICLHELQKNAAPETCFYVNAAAYIEDCATAKAIFICTANDLMGYFTLRPETTYIQLWHGCGAFKKVGLSTVGKKFGKNAKARAEFPDHTNYSYVTVASPEVAWIFEESMGIDKDSGIIVPTGISRTDVFFDSKYIENCYKKIHKKIPATNQKKIILYAPTFRGEVATATSPDVLDVKKFFDAFHDEYILIFKHHQSAKTIPEIPEQYCDTFAFDMTRGKGMDINELMTVADIMITDYSSVVFEYALFERPMVFLTHDIDTYIDERGLYYDFDEVTPGPLCSNNEELIDYIQNIEERFDKQEVIDFKNKFMSCCDGHSTERIIQLIESEPQTDH